MDAPLSRRALVGLCAALAGCGATPLTDGGTPTDGGDAPFPSGSTTPPEGATFGYTYLRADGNRVVGGRGRVPTATPLDVSVDGTPRWLVGTTAADGTVWATVLSDGRVEAVRLADGQAESVSVAPDTHTGPPLLAAGDAVRLVTGGSALTHPVPTAAGLATVHDDGRLTLPGGTLDVNALPDARPVVGDGRLYLLADPTTAYGHGVLGDEREAETVAVVDPAGPTELSRLSPPDGTVVEGIAPIVADVDDDGTREVVATASDATSGARLVAIRSDGAHVEGPPIGTGFRWRHQLAVASFAPDGSVEVAAVRTPHVGGRAEFYRADGDRLGLVAGRDGYSSHRIGSRNLDMAAAGDFDGDGRAELLVPVESMRAVAGLRRTADGVAEPWRVPLGGELTTNLAVVERAGTVTLAAGRPGGLRFWPG